MNKRTSQREDASSDRNVKCLQKNESVVKNEADDLDYVNLLSEKLLFVSTSNIHETDISTLVISNYFREKLFSYLLTFKHQTPTSKMVAKQI